MELDGPMAEVINLVDKILMTMEHYDIKGIELDRIRSSVGHNRFDVEIRRSED